MQHIKMSLRNSCLIRKRLISYYDFHAVFPEDLASFWTEHSERATLPTALAMLGVENKKRDLVGRWKPEASDIYVPSYNGWWRSCSISIARP